MCHPFARRFALDLKTNCLRATNIALTTHRCKVLKIRTEKGEKGDSLSTVNPDSNKFLVHCEKKNIFNPFADVYYYVRFNM